MVETRPAIEHEIKEITIPTINQLIVKKDDDSKSSAYN